MFKRTVMTAIRVQLTLAVLRAEDVRLKTFPTEQRVLIRTATTVPVRTESVSDQADRGKRPK
jgi:hypothetical protein